MAIHLTIAPYETLAAKDGHLALCVGNDGQFVRLAAEFEDVELAVDARFTTNAHRVQNPMSSSTSSTRGTCAPTPSTHGWPA
ncbi:CoA transferase [Streptomyces samsunensis]|uniref:CoA transferase n=1 Tax=Streptomyces malaysiensis subsp. samsunensis TaxID=459658 RepID=A0A9X2LXJ5_STRMQ|nr:CoA transferase [Streptomyces samsunensis]MCQ8831291.1 CoA transferase [Streptomyces samsunensis]WPB90727.1 CoA transferase [Streptomyces malaysiensis]